jgi:hypothetical protein
MATAWDNDATWKSFGSGIQANDLEALSTVDVTSSSYVSSGWTDFDVTTSLAAWPADPSSNFGWAMLPTDTNSVQFYTSDNVSYWVPRLSVDYPAPAGDVHSDAPDGSATPLDLSSGSATAFGTFEAAGDSDVFQFTVTQSTTITIDLGWTGANSIVDTFLELYDASGTSSYNSRLTITLGAGTYFVSAGTFADSVTSETSALMSEFEFGPG